MHVERTGESSEEATRSKVSLKRKRRRKQSRRERERLRRERRRRLLRTAGLAISLVGGLALVILPLILAALDPVLSLLGVPLLAVGLATVGVAAHRQYLFAEQRWMRHGCPVCDHPDLKRLERRRHHRFFGAALRVPWRRYICPECGWKGLRIDDTRIV